MNIATSHDFGSGRQSGTWGNVLEHGVRLVWTDSDSGVITIGRGPMQSIDDVVEDGEEILVTAADNFEAVADQVRQHLKAGAQGPLDFPAKGAPAMFKDDVTTTPEGIGGIAEYLDGFEAVCKRCNVSHDLFKTDLTAFEQGCPACHAPRGSGCNFNVRVKAWVYSDPNRLDIEKRIAEWNRTLFNYPEGVSVPTKINVERDG